MRQKVGAKLVGFFWQYETASEPNAIQEFQALETSLLTYSVYILYMPDGDACLHIRILNPAIAYSQSQCTCGQHSFGSADVIGDPYADHPSQQKVGVKFWDKSRFLGSHLFSYETASEPNEVRDCSLQD